MAQLQALIFDVDGTLAETERDGHRLAFNRAFADLNLDWDWSVGLYGQLLEVAGGKERIRHYLERYQPPVRLRGDVDQFIADLHRRKTDHFKDIVQAGGIAPRPGVLRLIRQAQAAGVRLAIATTSSPENAIALLQCALAPNAPLWFDVIGAGDVIPCKKPAPDIYQYVLDKLALPPDACLVIEDSRQGLLSATAAGLTTVVTVNDYTRRQNLREASLVISHLGEPNQPFEILHGDARQAYYFTLDLAQSLLRPTL